jgi:DNA-binding NtrC family response regulator
MRGSILVVDDEAPIRALLCEGLAYEGCSVAAVGSGEEAVARLREENFDVVVCDIVLPGIRGLDVLRQARSLRPSPTFILITGHASVDTAVAALRHGASDYLVKPFRLADLAARVRGFCTETRSAGPGDTDREDGVTNVGDLVGRSPAIATVRRKITQFAPTSSTILLRGETGTGKEVVARAIHAASPRHRGPFVAINCGAIPDSLFESQLFGHVRGAFTSAINSNPGLFAAANGGTLFLDEVGELPVPLQVKLLRVIEDKTVWAVGATRPVPVDNRIMASTNRDLRKEMSAGRFREDLYYRLHVAEIVLPPLRERREDIPLLVEHFIARLNLALGKRVRGIDEGARRALMAHPWRGNVRELEHVVETSVITLEGEVLTVRDLPPEVADDGGAMPMAPVHLKNATQRFERQQILDVLAVVNFDKRAAARRLGLSLPSLYRKLQLP